MNDHLNTLDTTRLKLVFISDYFHLGKYGGYNYFFTDSSNRLVMVKHKVGSVEQITDGLYLMHTFYYYNEVLVRLLTQRFKPRKKRPVYEKVYDLTTPSIPTTLSEPGFSQTKKSGVRYLKEYREYLSRTQPVQNADSSRLQEITE